MRILKNISTNILGKITKEQIKYGYEALTCIEVHILNNELETADFKHSMNE